MTSQVLQPRHPFHFDYHPYRNHYPTADSFSVADPVGLTNGTPLLDTTEQGILDEFLRNPEAFNDGNVIPRGHQTAPNANFDFLMNEATPELHNVSLFDFDLSTPTQPTMNQWSSPTSTHFNSMDILSQASALSHGIQVPPQHLLHGTMSMDMATTMSPTTTAGHFAPQYPTAISTNFFQPAPVTAPMSAPISVPIPSPTRQQRPTIKQRRQTDAAVGSQLIFDLKPYDDQADRMPTPAMSAGFEEGHVGIPLVSQSAGINRPQPFLHARHHSESFLNNIHFPSTAATLDDGSNKRLYRFGSDTAHFAPDGFIRGEGDPSAAELTRRIMDGNFGAIAGGHISPSGSRAQSPSADNRRPKREASFDSDEEPSSRRRKVEISSRRMSTVQGLRQRASSTDLAPNRRRKSSPPGSAARRPPRENLTDEQKRSNHILSEQRRRNIIKKGFDYINNMVPGLREGGYSKSNVLNEATEYMGKLVSGNDDLKRALGF